MAVDQCTDAEAVSASSIVHYFDTRLQLCAINFYAQIHSTAAWNVTGGYRLHEAQIIMKFRTDILEEYGKRQLHLGNNEYKLNAECCEWKPAEGLMMAHPPTEVSLFIYLIPSRQ